MTDGSQTEVSNDSESGVKETPLGGKEFSGAIEQKDPMAAQTVPAPEGIPEKFWDPIEGKLRTEDLVKSYQALEAKLGQPKDDEDGADKGDDDDTDKGDDEDQSGDDTDKGADDKEDGEDKGGDEDQDAPVDKAAFTAALDEAQKVYAETGELPDEARKPFLDLGFSNQQIELYLAGVKATEAALTNAAHKAAGSAEDYAAAVEWAANGGLSKKQIEAFNAQTGDVETIGPAVAGLMAAFRKAEPGEGHLASGGRISSGDVYDSMEEFQQDLSKADQVRDPVARKKAIDKLARSRAAGTIKTSHRRQPFGSGSK